MSTTTLVEVTSQSLSDKVAKRYPENCFCPNRVNWRDAFIADWTDATFVHYAVEPQYLQPYIPFELDLFDGLAYVSLVAFSMEQMRPAFLDSPLGEFCMWPISPCRFLNVRTYVKAGAASGIYFMGEWLSQWLNVPLGPIAYGLPYHAGWLRYTCAENGGVIAADVSSIHGNRLAFRAKSPPDQCVSATDSLDQFLLERYHAFTMRGTEPLAFRVQHESWQQSPAKINIEADDLLRETGEWVRHAKLAGGHITPGVRDVRMSAPVWLTQRSAARTPRSCWLSA